MDKKNLMKVPPKKKHPELSPRVPYHFYTARYGADCIAVTRV